MWWRPAAATSRALRALYCPATSDRSGSRSPPMRSAPSPAPGTASPASSESGRPSAVALSCSSSGTGSSVSTAISCLRLRTPRTETPGTRDASATVFSGTTTWRYPASAAARTAGRTPRTGRTRPSSPSSPIMTRSDSSRGSIRSAAPSTAQATARSNPLPPLGTEAGLRPTVSFFCGHSPPEFTTAARTLSRDSIKLLSGSPTSAKAATPGSRSAWTSTTTPSTPTSATEHVRANPMSGHSSRMLQKRRAARRQQHADHVDAHSAGRWAAVGLQPAFRQAQKAGGLLRPYGCHGMFVRARAAGLDLTEHQGVTVGCHDVDLTLLASPVAVQDAHADRGQVTCGQVFPVASERAACTGDGQVVAGGGRPDGMSETAGAGAAGNGTGIGWAVSAACHRPAAPDPRCATAWLRRCAAQSSRRLLRGCRTARMLLRARLAPVRPVILLVRGVHLAPPPAPTVTLQPRTVGSWWTTERLWTTSSLDPVMPPPLPAPPGPAPEPGVRPSRPARRRLSSPEDPDRSCSAPRCSRP